MNEILYISISFVIYILLVSVDGDVTFNNVCDIVVSTKRGAMTKFHVEEENSNCKGKVRFKLSSTNQTYCIPILDGKNDILFCQVSHI